MPNCDSTFIKALFICRSASCGRGKDSSAFFCHPAESFSGSDETGRGGVVFIRQIFSLSHILGTRDRVGIAHSPVSALNYAHPRVSETTQAED